MSALILKPGRYFKHPPPFILNVKVRATDSASSRCSGRIKHRGIGTNQIRIKFGRKLWRAVRKGKDRVNYSTGDENKPQASAVCDGA